MSDPFSTNGAITSSYVGACRKDIPYPSVSHESVPSLIDNLVTALYGTFTKNIVNKKVVWNVPCTPQTQQIAGITPLTGEGMLCYLARVLNIIFPNETEPVTLDAVQTLTNKTLTSPVIISPTISNLTATGTLGLPTGSITSTMIANGTILPADLSTGAPTWDTSGNLTANSFIGSLQGNVATATTATNLSGTISGSIPYQSGSATTSYTAAGTTGQVLTSAGTSTPTWTSQSSIAAGTATTATNLAGGAAGTIYYQTGSGATTTLGIGTAGQMLVVNAGATAPSWSTDHKGTTTNDNVPYTGYVGEYVTASLASGSAVSLTTATPANVISIPLTAGDWKVVGVVDFTLTGTTSVLGTNNYIGGQSSTSATLGSQDTYFNFPFVATTLTGGFNQSIPTQRISLSTATTIYLVAQATFSAGTVKAYGTISARRMR